MNEELKKLVFMEIPFKPEGLTATGLEARLGISERTIRRAIKELRKDGHKIMNDSAGSGYWCELEEERVGKW